ncbi:MAG: hypothetical protein QOH46_1653 [Solirubrobacteraceae bacterium]|jgi:hypothetical protein|nr:hypothetical protein [Solirubrobacteraceae bacterium]
MRDEAERPASAAEPARLAGVLVALFVGAAAGGLLLVHARTLAPALRPPIALSVIAVAARVFGVDGAAGLPRVGWSPAPPGA